MWGNVLPGILKSGRTEHIPPTDMDEGAVEEWVAAQEEKEKKDERFRGINEHTGLPGTALTPEAEGGEKKAWISRIVGDTQQYNPVKEGDALTSNCLNVLRSLRWPGAVTVAKGKKVTSVYVGYGMKKGGALFTPDVPPEVMSDP